MIQRLSDNRPKGSYNPKTKIFTDDYGRQYFMSSDTYGQRMRCGPGCRCSLCQPANTSWFSNLTSVLTSATGRASPNDFSHRANFSNSYRVGPGPTQRSRFSNSYRVKPGQTQRSRFSNMFGHTPISTPRSRFSGPYHY